MRSGDDPPGNPTTIFSGLLGQAADWAWTAGRTNEEAMAAPMASAWRRVGAAEGVEVFFMLVSF
jgi:hypothetical protein